jgi:hypothetical protein
MSSKCVMMTPKEFLGRKAHITWGADVGRTGDRKKILMLVDEMV